MTLSAILKTGSWRNTIHKMPFAVGVCTAFIAGALASAMTVSLWFPTPPPCLFWLSGSEASRFHLSPYFFWPSRSGASAFKVLVSHLSSWEFLIVLTVMSMLAGRPGVIRDAMLLGAVRGMKRLNKAVDNATNTLVHCLLGYIGGGNLYI